MAEARSGALRAGERIPELDGLRGVAVLLVVFLHCVARAPSYLADSEPLSKLPESIRRLADISWCGVDLFFVLSGFLIGGILLDHGRSPRLWQAFYARRAARILPLYLTIVALAFAFPAEAGHNPYRPVPLWGYLLFIQNFWTATGSVACRWLGPCWSIAIEEQFYLVAPWLITRLAPRTLVTVLLSCILGGLGLRCVLLFYPGALPFHVSSWDFTLGRFDGPAFGVLGAWMVRQASVRAFLARQLTGLKWFAALLLFVVVGLSQFKPQPWFEAVILSFGLSVLAALSLAAILICVLSPNGLLARLMRVVPLMAAGRYSYFVYLFHIPVLSALGSRLHAGYWVQVGMCWIVLALLARYSWRFFESPLLKLGQSVRYEAPAAPAID
jgi:peptidoglycan/LPS O-acetylase OafA/YrhL